MKLHWNTGRQYGPEGQRFAVVVVSHTYPELRIVFHDIDRGIDGEIRIACRNFDVSHTPDILRLVMWAYDRGLYVATQCDSETANIMESIKSWDKAQENSKFLNYKLYT